MAPAHEFLQKNLNCQALSDDRFSAPDDKFGLPNPYGGRLLGQAVSAASQTVVNDRPMHSMHAYFMRKGKREQAITYQVERLRDGANFSSRRVEAIQEGKTLFSCICGFHNFEKNLESPLYDTPPCPSPDTLDRSHMWKEISFLQQLIKKNPLHPLNAFDLRFVPDRHPDCSNHSQSKRKLWVRFRGETTGIHQQQSLLAWISDFFLLPTALKTIGVDLHSEHLKIASLDHSIWIHSPLELRQWLLFDFNCTIFGYSRAHTDAKIYTQQGEHIASMTQEGLLQLQAESNLF